jgi:hypothetical protein
MPSRPSPLACVTIAAAAGALALLLWMPKALLSGDEGVKLIQAEALVSSGWHSRALPYPGGEVDPAGAHFPLRPPFAWRHEGAWYGLYPTPFVAVTAITWRLFGMRGLYVLPWLGAVVAVLLTGLIGRRALASEAWGAAVAATCALASPLLLYASLHWEHTVAVALVLGALALLADESPSRARLVWAGVLVGAGPAIRTELYCVPVAVIGFALVLWGPRRQAIARLLVVGAAAAAVAGVFWLWNYATLGTWDPVVTVNRATNARKSAADG